jgi:hypothetical protein
METLTMDAHETAWGGELRQDFGVLLLKFEPEIPLISRGPFKRCQRALCRVRRLFEE